MLFGNYQHADTRNISNMGSSYFPLHVRHFQGDRGGSSLRHDVWLSPLSVPAAAPLFWALLLLGISVLPHRFLTF